MATKSRKQLISRLVDIVIFLCGAGCFAAAGYLHSKGLPNPAGEPIAKVKYGHPERKRSGMIKFSEISPDTDLFHRDAIWVGEGKSVQIVFNQGALLRLKEKTFIVIERQMSEDLTIQVLTGQVNIEGPTSQQINIEQLSQMPEEPSSEPAPASNAAQPSTSPTPRERDVYPKPKSIIYIATGQATHEVTFSWPKAYPGVFSISGDGKEINRTTVAQELFTKFRLEVGVSYEWKILDSQNKILTGPHVFQLKKFDINAINIGAGADPEQSIEIIQ